MRWSKLSPMCMFAGRVAQSYTNSQQLQPHLGGLRRTCLFRSKAMRRLPATVRHSVLLLAVACCVGGADALIIDAGDCKCCSRSEPSQLILGCRVDSSYEFIESIAIESKATAEAPILHPAGVAEQSQCSQSRAKAGGALCVLLLVRLQMIQNAGKQEVSPRMPTQGNRNTAAEHNSLTVHCSSIGKVTLTTHTTSLTIHHAGFQRPNPRLSTRQLHCLRPRTCTQHPFQPQPTAMPTRPPPTSPFTPPRTGGQPSWMEAWQLVELGKQ
jgi:hypothetical protein